MDEATFNRAIEGRIAMEPNSGCWLWTGSTGTAGYPYFSYKGKTYSMHRLMWQFKNGRQLTKPEFICHKCDVRCCINPAHMFVGSHSDNMRDMLRKRRAWNQKLTLEDAAYIKRSNEPPSVLAARYGVVAPLIYNIRAGIAWRHA